MNISDIRPAPIRIMNPLTHTQRRPINITVTSATSGRHQSESWIHRHIHSGDQSTSPLHQRHQAGTNQNHESTDTYIAATNQHHRYTSDIYLLTYLLTSGYQAMSVQQHSHYLTQGTKLCTSLPAATLTFSPFDPRASPVHLCRPQAAPMAKVWGKTHSCK